MFGFRFKTLLVFLVFLAACGKAPVAFKGGNIEGTPFQLHWNLVNQWGAASDGSELKGKVSLLYFGFTECPDVCFATLNRVATAMKTLSAAGVDVSALRVVFISIDSEHDRPEVLKQYLERFPPQFIGLTGSEAAVQSAIKDFKVYAAKDKQSRAFEHSGYLYVFDRQSKPRVLISPEGSVEDLAADLRVLLSQ